MLVVTPKGRVDTAATTVMGTTQKKFLDSLNVNLTSWQLRPARENGKMVAGRLPVTVKFQVRDCTWPDSMAHQTVHTDSVPALITVSACTLTVFGPLFMDPKAVRTVRTRLRGLWSYGFEDGYYTPCKSVNLHINPHGITTRTMRPLLRLSDSVAVPIYQRIRTLGGEAPGTHRYFVEWDVELTGPKRVGLAVWEFRPLNLIDVQKWEDKSCPLK